MTAQPTRARAPVHAAAASPRGASEPRQEGPPDLRLVPPAVTAWIAAAVALGTPGRTVAVVCALACLAAAALLFRTSHPLRARDLLRSRDLFRARHLFRDRGLLGVGHRTDPAMAGRPRAGTPRPHHGPDGTRPPGAVLPAHDPATRTGGRGVARDTNSPTHGGGRRRSVAGAVAAALLCGAAAGAVAALHAAEVREGPVPSLAREYAGITAEVKVTGDPRLTRPRVRGAALAPVAVVIEAEVGRVTGPDGTTTVTRAPVLVTVRAGAARERARWLELLPSTRLRLHGRLAPPLREGDRVAAVVRVDGGGPPRVIGEPSALQQQAGRLRAGLRTATDGLSPDARALLPGLVVGDTSRVPPDLDEAFRATDLLHLMAVSGSNLTLVLALLIGPPRLAARAERRGLAAALGLRLRATAVLGGALTLCFVIVCRPEPSVLRAAVCGLITLLALGTGRRRSLLPALAAAVLALVLYDPWLARDYGFALSVLATGALLTFAPVWSAALRRRGVPGRWAEVLAAAAAAQAVCAPVVVVLAERVSLVGVPCNLLAEVAVGPATVLGFAALAAAPFAPPLAGWIAWPAGWPAEWIAEVARRGAALPGAELDWPGGWQGGLLLALATLAAVLVGRRVLHHRWLCAVCALGLLLAVVRPAPLARVITGWPPSGWRLVACDVGQGDALVLAAGSGTAVVVDTGPEPHAVDRCLRSLGVVRIPLLVLTHFHADHVAGLTGVLRGRGVGAIETTSLEDPPGQAEFVRRRARAAHVPVVAAEPGERRRFGPLSWEVLWPAPPPPASPPATPAVPTTEGANDASVTLFVRTAGLTLLLLGDLEPPAQRALLAAHPELPRVDVVKVAHHGSAYQDPRLMHRLRPRLALISCGADNPYGHPSPRTIAALRVQGAAVLRTDTDGPIAVTGPALRAVLRRPTRRSASDGAPGARAPRTRPVPRWVPPCSTRRRSRSPICGDPTATWPRRCRRWRPAPRPGRTPPRFPRSAPHHGCRPGRAGPSRLPADCGRWDWSGGWRARSPRRPTGTTAAPGRHPLPVGGRHPDVRLPLQPLQQIAFALPLIAHRH
nr:ComEC/Rec2 family competence protein [Streptomyces coffeae]